MCQEFVHVQGVYWCGWISQGKRFFVLFAQPKGPQMIGPRALETSDVTKTFDAVWSVTISNTIKEGVGRYGCPVVKTISALAATRSCRLVYLTPLVVVGMDSLHKKLRPLHLTQVVPYHDDELKSLPSHMCHYTMCITGH